MRNMQYEILGIMREILRGKMGVYGQLCELEGFGTVDDQKREISHVSFKVWVDRILVPVVEKSFVLWKGCTRWLYAATICWNVVHTKPTGTL
jgi:hypothetical protein